MSLQRIQYSDWMDSEVEVYVKRDDLLHPMVSGNKFRKLKYNLKRAQEEKHHTVLTYGGAYSNHIAATAAACKLLGLKSVGIIRGEELKFKILENPTLRFAHEQGMSFEFITRTQYREKETLKFHEKYGDYYEIPEGGTNDLAVLGCEEILLEESKNDFDFVAVACGTGGTISGMIRASNERQTILGFPALKGAGFLNKIIQNYTDKDNWKLIEEYHFGGYAKFNKNLITFINSFKRETDIPLDPVYTGKMLYGIDDMIKKRLIPNGSKLLLIHTGGLQGIEGFNKLLKQKNQQTIL
ncbi:pyridoxal-phosphate dependent enzyme [Flavobacteriaceae bacterium]|nr:pyridoxal-phosphate dependent enzyme [Flavobacteriaceae bacterium]